MYRPVHEKGFTLIELLVTFAVLAIIVTIAAPSFQELIRNNQVATETNTLISGLQLARSEAVKRGAEVSLTADGASFAAGYCVHTGGTGSSCTNSTRIRQFEAMDSSLSSAVTQVSFDRMGQLVGNAAITANVTPSGCPSGKVDALRQIRVGLGGQVTVSRGNCP